MSVISRFNRDGNMIGRFSGPTDAEFLALNLLDRGDVIIFDAGADLTGFTVDSDMTLDTGANSFVLMYDGSEWIVVDQDSGGGGSTCPAPMTRSALIGLRNAGNLKPECHYVLTDYSRGTVGAATIMLHALDATTLSMQASVKVGFDNLAWQGRYDIDANRLVELSDNIGNVVKGQEIVDSFPWGTSGVYDNIVEEGGALTFVSGQLYDNKISSQATLIVNAGTVARNEFKEYSNTTINGGSFYENTVKGDSTITWNAGSCYANHFGEETTLVQNGTRNFYRNNCHRAASITLGNVSVYDNEFSRSTFNCNGSTGNIRYCSFKDCTSLTGAQNVGNIDWAYCSFNNNSQTAINGADRVYLRYVTIENFGRIIASAGTLLDMNYTGLRDYAYVQVQGGRLYVNYSSLRGVSYIQQAATVTGTNRVDRLDMSGNSRARFLGTVTNCRIYYCDVSSGSYIEHRGTSSGCYFYYCKVSSSSSLYTNNSVNLRGYYMGLSGNSQYYSQNVSATHYAYYNVMNGHGYLRHYNSTGGRLYAVHCHGQAIVNLVGATPAGRLYYSNFDSYYYLTASNWTVTRYALNGSGRRSYTVTNPPNGTYTQNF